MADKRLDPTLWDCDGALREAAQIVAPLAPVTAAPDAEAPMTSQLLFGESFTIRARKTGWAFGQTGDGYVGWTPDYGLGAPASASHRVSALNAILYSRPDLKSRPLGALPLGARLTAEADKDGYVAIAPMGWIPAAHVAPPDGAEPDWVAVAERFVGAPYLWGGRSAAGIDCSGLIQIARQAAGHACARDSDMQMNAAGRDVKALRRGDLIFWRGHVGAMVSPSLLLHANAHYMAVAIEPLAQAEARIAAAEGPILARRRWAA